MNKYRVTVYTRNYITYFVEGEDWDQARHKGLAKYQAEEDPDDLNCKIQGIDVEEQEYDISEPPAAIDIA